jgi:glycosyltransferase involved in cell wall biosynthesis
VIDARFLIPGNLDTPTGGYAYDRQILHHLQQRAFPLVPVELGGEWPAPTAKDIAICESLFHSFSEKTALLIDGLAFGAMPETLLKQAKGPLIALCHHPLAYETGLDESRRRELHMSEKAALAHARSVIVTSDETAGLLAREFSVSERNIVIALPGTRRMRRARGGGDIPHLVAIGSVSRRKNYDGLLEALRQIADLSWRLTIAGRVEDEGLMASLMERTSANDWGDRIQFTGALPDDAIETLLVGADLFVMPSHYEGYGMAVMEAVASGLPSVTTDAVPSARQVPAGAIKSVPLGDSAAFGTALRVLLTDAEARKKMATLAWDARAKLPNWETTSDTVAAAIEKALT